jgi:hypothetical protein
MKVTYQNRKLANFVKKFIINFILFLKDREVIYHHHVRGAKNRERRVKQGKVPLPDSNVVKLTGQLHRYVSSLRPGDFKGALSYKFWVAGHWRTYKAERYKQMKGKVVWIEPYKKGEGVEVRRVYRVEPDDMDDVLDYDNIKALDKPLREMRT